MSAVSLTAGVHKLGVNLYVTITAFCDSIKLPILRNSEVLISAVQNSSILQDDNSAFVKVNKHVEDKYKSHPVLQ
jgi:hypothetical protein